MHCKKYILDQYLLNHILKTIPATPPIQIWKNSISNSNGQRPSKMGEQLELLTNQTRESHLIRIPTSIFIHHLILYHSGRHSKMKQEPQQPTGIPQPIAQLITQLIAQLIAQIQERGQMVMNHLCRTQGAILSLAIQHSHWFLRIM